MFVKKAHLTLPTISGATKDFAGIKLITIFQFVKLLKKVYETLIAFEETLRQLERSLKNDFL